MMEKMDTTMMKKSRYGIVFKKLFMDYQSQQDGGDITNFQNYSHGFEVAYIRPINKNITVTAPIKVGVVRDVVDLEELKKTVLGLDAQVQYGFGKAESIIKPYFMAGLGGVMEFEGDFNIQAPLGFGLNFEIQPNLFFNLQSEYRIAFAENRNNLHHGLGFIYYVGEQSEKVKEPKESDIDGDGVTDAEDLCPQLPGLAELDGCPDTDGDGVADYQDACPDVAGFKSFSGCPDTDGDGVADKEDDCPNMAGSRSNKGCPDVDTDNDGIPNELDNCPNTPGPASNKGCPETKAIADRDGDGVEDDKDLCPDKAGSSATAGCPDSDGDGISDIDDKCPDAAGLRVYGGCPDTDGDGIDDSRDQCPRTPGPVSSNGCPEITKEDRKTLDVAMRAVEFDTGKSTLKSSSYSILDQIVRIMNRYPDYNIVISGHTDNTGKTSANQALSESRARACYEYLNRQGIALDRMTYVGYGETRPIAENTTLSGRSLNRRVEFQLVPRG